MANTVRIKRRVGGEAGAPPSLANAELAFNEVNNVLYYGKGTGGAGGSATTIEAIAGAGAFVNLSGAQTISGNKTFTGTLDVSGATIDTLSTTGNVTVGGNLTVNGTTTTVNSTTVTVDDKNIELGSVAEPSDTTADGGGIVLKGATDKTISWLDATDSWTFNQSVELTSGKVYRIDGAEVLSKTALGSGVTGSSLTSVGTLTSGSLGSGFSTVATAQGGTGQITYTDGQLLIGNSTGNTLAKATLTAGSNINITNGPGTITIASTSGVYTAGNGLDLTTGEFSLDLKANGGLVIESTELALDLSASSITGTLAIVDGGTGATDAGTARSNLGLAIGTNVQAYDADLDSLSGMQAGAASALALLTSTEIQILDGATVTTTELNIVDGSTSATAVTLAQADRMVINDNGTMVQVALSDLVTFLEDGTASGFDIDGGTW